MLIVRLDRAVQNSGRLSAVCEKALHKIFRTKLSEEILLCIISAAAAGFLAFDLSRGGLLYIVSAAVMCAVWSLCALLCGFRRQWGWGVFAAAFWLLPQLFIYRADNVVTFAEYDKTVDIIGKISHIFVTDSIGLFCGGENPEKAAVITAVVILVAVEILMVAGMLLREHMRYSDFYCAFREDNPQYK